MHGADRGGVDVEDVHRLPVELVDLLDRLRRLLRRRRREEQVRAGILDLEDLQIDGRVGDFVGGFRHDHLRRLVAEAGLDAVQVVLAEVVVLIEDADLGVRMFFQDVLAVDASLDEVVGVEAHRPGKILRIGELRRAGRGEQLRHLLGVEIFLHRRVRGRAEELEGEQHFVALDQLAHLLDRLGRRVGVVILDQVDLAAVHAALIVDHLHIGGLGLADGGIGGGRSGERIGLADLDLGIGRAGVVFFLRVSRRDRQRNRERRAGNQMENTLPHILAFLMVVIEPMILPGALFEPKRTPSLPAILAEAHVALQGARGGMAAISCSTTEQRPKQRHRLRLHKKNPQVSPCGACAPEAGTYRSETRPPASWAMRRRRRSADRSELFNRPGRYPR